ncbi:biopolymer transport protein [Saprospira grandis DSM 2844]|uniref:Biopolymer transport protein n=1 Tax=Saprospira grandis DSM 2844 TaxID=694433 RepID=J0PAJ6_9BACT|nr:biopolymer transporter ExbD [Saprospira grandis]EJF54612.1 biopolymer transport protein [Saprospira grandis DSM 2844]
MGLKKRTEVSAEFNMSSLTDIIFLLLIFFMLTSSLVNPTAINLKLPNSSRSKPISSNKPAIIVVNESKEIRFNQLKVDIPALKAKVGQYVLADGRTAGDVTVILDVHPKVDAQTLVSVVDALNDVGVKMILATRL